MMKDETGCGDGCACGAPQRAAFLTVGAPSSAFAPSTATPAHIIEQVGVPAGSFTMGDSSGDRNPHDGEVPLHEVHLDGFDIDATTVTNTDFAKFVEATGYATEAEVFGFSAVFHLELDAPQDDIIGRPRETPWWFGVRGADWRHPGGRHSSIEGVSDHPVVHVSWNDAIAYCMWAERRLPTEAEWEYAARGGLEAKKYPWGDEEVDVDGWRTNIFQGRFPDENTMQDGYSSTAPVRTFEPNGYGLWQPVGNVWEWCADWYSPDYYRHSAPTNPRGPAHGTMKSMRGGSFLCHDSYCNRYRNSARSQNTPDSSMSNAGFRTVALTHK